MPPKVKYTREIEDFINDLQKSYYTKKEAYERLFEKSHGIVLIKNKYNNAKFKNEFNRKSKNKVETIEELQKKYQESCDLEIIQSIRLSMAMDAMSLFK